MISYPDRPEFEKVWKRQQAAPERRLQFEKDVERRMEEEEREGGEEEEAMAEVLRAMGAAVAHATAEEGAWPMGKMVRGRGELASRPEGEEGWAAQGRRGGGRAEPAAGGRGGWRRRLACDPMAPGCLWDVEFIYCRRRGHGRKAMAPGAPLGCQGYGRRGER